MGDGVRDIAHSVHQQFDLIEHPVDGAREDVEFIVAQMRSAADASNRRE